MNVFPKGVQLYLSKELQIYFLKAARYQAELQLNLHGFLKGVWMYFQKMFNYIFLKKFKCIFLKKFKSIFLKRPDIKQNNNYIHMDFLKEFEYIFQIDFPEEVLYIFWMRPDISRITVTFTCILEGVWIYFPVKIQIYFPK